MSADPVGQIVHINGWPGCGKLTIARHLAKMLGARLVDNHTLIDPAEALFSRRDPLYSSLRAEIRASVLSHIERASAETSFVFTDALSDDAWDSSVFDDYRKLAAARGAPFLAVVLDCSLEENLRRLESASRQDTFKLTQPDRLLALREQYRLLRGPADRLVELDVTDLQPQDAAAVLNDRLRA